MTSAQSKPLRLFNLSPLLLAMAVAGCGTTFQPLPGPVEFGRSAKAQGTLGTAPQETRQTGTVITALPASPLLKQAANDPTPSTATSAQADGDEEVSIAIEQTPLPMFIQILYGSILKRAYSLDPAVTARTEPVTFKTSRPISKARMQQIAANLLRSYGLTAVDLDGLVRIAPDSAAANPSLRVQTGKQIPDGADPFRPAHHYVELEIVRTAEMQQWLRQVLGARVTLQEDVGRNAFMLSGTQADIKAALGLIQTFDQPRMRGRIARRISPAYTNATDLASRLSEALGIQGYSVSNSGSTGSATIVLMAVPATASLFAFTSSQSVMEHVERWAVALDKPSSGAISNALFTYPVKYADAVDLAKTIGELLGGGGGGAPAAAAGGAATRQTSFGRVVVNNATNTLIFKGSSAEEQLQIKELLRELDRPTKSAMIEVVVAEVQRGALESLGIKWDYNSFANAGPKQTTAKIGGAGLNLGFVNSASNVIAALDALATNSQARILSNPKILARNGETATIQVGNEVPIITSTQSTGTTSGFPGSGGGQTGLIQTVQYRSTGVILRVRPVINSGNRLDLDVSQEVSSAASTQTGVSASPTISTRRIETKLSLRDGSTILLGGLIARDESKSDAGVPYLKDIPGLGALFRSNNFTSKQTELLVMITPYVVNDDYEAEELTQAIQHTFGDWAKDIRTSRVALEPVSAPPPPAAPPKLDSSSTGQPPAIGISFDANTVPQQPVKQTPLGPDSTAKIPATNDLDDGVTTSRGTATPTPEAPAASPNSPNEGKSIIGSSAAPESKKPVVALPSGAKGSAVTDPKVLEDILKLMKPK